MSTQSRPGITRRTAPALLAAAAVAKLGIAPDAVDVSWWDGPGYTANCWFIYDEDRCLCWSAYGYEDDVQFLERDALDAEAA